MTIPLIFAAACILWMIGMTSAAWMLYFEMKRLRSICEGMGSELKQFRGVAKLKDLPNEQRSPDHQPSRNGQYGYGRA